LLISKYEAEGNFEKLIKKGLSTEDAMRYFTMIVVGLNYLHSQNFVHGNLKPSNIVVFKNEA
jgi:serine/threonine protein kinase